ncbi:MAG: nonstructural protein [Microviridae sp.]|nr:MAG: nonstructural protein [Microviridae sp.]
MRINAYTLYDRKALTYNTPFFFPNDGMAIRALQDLVSDNDTSIGRHPADYVLYHVGFYDTERALLEHVDPLRHVMDASALVPVTTGTLI